MPDVFISYSRSHREFTRTLAKELEEIRHHRLVGHRSDCGGIVP